MWDFPEDGYGDNLLLPTAYEVLGKVMFLHLSVILFMGRGVSRCLVVRGGIVPGRLGGGGRRGCLVKVGVSGQSRSPIFYRGVSHFCENGRPPLQYGNTVNARRSVCILLKCIIVS